MANTTIQLKKSSTPSATPASLANGEIAINYADGKIFYKNLAGQIATFQGDADLTPANNWANTKLSNTSGVWTAGQLNIPTTLYIGNNISSVNTVTFNVNDGTLDPSEGQIQWNPDDNTLDIGLANGSILQTGQETLYRVKNQTGVTINNGTVVMAAGTVGASGRILVAPFKANGQFESKFCMGVVTSVIPNGDDGYVTHFGKVRGVNTSMWPEGTILYANAEVAGAFTTILPDAPNNKITVAIVINSHDNNGTLMVRPTIGSRLNEDELAEVHSPLDGDIFQYVAANGRFENKQSIDITGNVTIGNSSFYSATYESLSTDDQIIDSFSTSSFRAAQYMITSKAGANYETTNITVLHDDYLVYMTEYGTVTTNNNTSFAGKLGQYNAVLVGGVVMLNVTPTYSSTTFRMLRTTNL